GVALHMGEDGVQNSGPTTRGPVRCRLELGYDQSLFFFKQKTAYELSFQLAAAGAFREAFQQAKPELLEPVYHLEILCPDEATGEVMGDLQTRRAIISGMDSEGSYQKIMAEVPLAELDDYGSTLRA